MEIKKLNYGWGVKLAVLLIICVQYTVTITSPILGTIMEAFPEHASMVKLLETIPTFAAVIISVLLGPLMKVFYKKQLLLFGIVLSFFQFIPAIVPGFWPLFICRTVAGFGIGFMYSFAASFAVDMFDEKGAADMLGLRSTLGAVMGIVYQQLSARFAVASGSYQRSFMVALILVPIFLYILFMMPKSCPVEDYNREQAKLPHEEKAKEKIYYPLTIALLAVQFLTLLFSYAFMTNVSIVTSTAVEAGGMGMTAATAANVLSVFTVAIAVGGLLYARVWCRIFKNFTTGAGILFLCVGMIINFTAAKSCSLPLLMVGTVLYGFGFEMNNSHLCQLLPLTSVPSAAASLLGVMYACINLGSFAAGFITPVISKAIFGEGILADWNLCIFGLAISAVLMLICCGAVNKQVKAKSTQQ